MDRDPRQDDGGSEPEEDSEGERHVVALQKFVGFIMLVMAWLQLLVAVSSNSEADSVPFLIFFAGLVIFVNGSVNAWYKYPIMGAATLAGLALHYHIRSIGVATFWEKRLVVFGAVIFVAVYVLFFGKKPARRIGSPPPKP